MTHIRHSYPHLPRRDQVIRLQHLPTGLVLVVWYEPMGGGLDFYNWLIADQSATETRLGSEETFEAAHLTGLIELHKLVLARMSAHPSGRSN